MILGPQILINAQVWVRAHNACVMEPPPRKPPWTAEGGLTAAQAQRRGLQDGPNELTPPQRRTLWHRLAEAARDPMLRLLLAASAIYGWLGELSDALVLLGFVLFSAGITLFQEQRTEKVLNALRELSSPRALVIRDGKRQRVSGTEVVCGDLLVVSEGDRIAADAVLRESSALRVDESVLTGESFPVDKSDEHPWIYGGTLVVRGQAVAQVVATGAHTEVGRIGASLADIARPVSPLVTQTRRLVQLFSVLGGLLSLTVLLLYGWARGNWLEASLAGITLAMSLLPEEFALILAVFMAMGAWRLSRHRVLTRRAHALEALGAITVLCTDKTGTLTHNRMQVVAMARWTGAGFEDWRAQEGDSGPPETLAPLARQAMLASEQAPQDPMEMALVTLALRMGSPQDRLDLQAWRCVHTYGWSAHCMAVTRLWQAHPASPEGALWVAAKGAPEAIGTLCRLNDTDREALRAHTAWLAQEGWRVLAVAQGTLQDRPWPSTPEGLTMSLVGLVALADPLREGVRSSVQECLQARIRVVMLTGDHPLTARAIAKQAGLDVSADVVTGDALAAMDASTWQQTVRSASVYARIMPQQKLRIVQALRAQGEVVAMTGDGVNDAPSLQAAHIGIAMGQRGTDVAREAACLVLLDDDFTAIVEAARLGRQMHDNLQGPGLCARGARAHCGARALARGAGGATHLAAPAHRVFGIVDRPGVFHGLRGRAPRGRPDAAAAARPTSPAVSLADGGVELGARRRGVGWRGHDGGVGLAIGVVGSGLARLDFLHLVGIQCRPHRGQPGVLAKSVAQLATTQPHPLAFVGADGAGGGQHFGVGSTARRVWV